MNVNSSDNYNIKNYIYDKINNYEKNNVAKMNRKYSNDNYSSKDNSDILN